MEIYIMCVLGSAICAYTEYSAALKNVLSTIAELTGETYTGSTEEELYKFLDDFCDVANIETLELHDN